MFPFSLVLVIICLIANFAVFILFLIDDLEEHGYERSVIQNNEYSQKEPTEHTTQSEDPIRGDINVSYDIKPLKIAWKLFIGVACYLKFLVARLFYSFR